MDLKRQASAPLYEAIEKFRKKRIVPFDVPGHKRGRGNPELVDLLGERCVGIDVNSMKPLDNLCHPVSVIKEAEELTAEAFGAEHAFFMVGGTTQAVQNMVLSVCKAGDEIIVPRNVHKSVINALILCGAIPVYLNTEINAKLGIVLGVTVQQVEKTIQEHPNAVAVLVNNPTYYGICSDIKGICDIAHSYGLKVLADEAHGTHLYFGDNLPMNSMKAGADLAAISMHKSGGSLTQSSILLTNNGMNADYVQTIINITQTTSASYLLMTSLDISRRNLALRGRQSFAKVSEWAQYARDEINIIVGDTDDPGTSIADTTQGIRNEDGTYIGVGDTAWEATLREAYGDHFINMRTYLIENGLTDVGLRPTVGDYKGFRRGRISKQLRYDWTHFNSYGYYSGHVVIQDILWLYQLYPMFLM